MSPWSKIHLQRLWDHQCLSQDVETGCPKLVIVNCWVSVGYSFMAETMMPIIPLTYSCLQPLKQPEVFGGGTWQKACFRKMFIRTQFQTLLQIPYNFKSLIIQARQVEIHSICLCHNLKFWRKHVLKKKRKGKMCNRSTPLWNHLGPLARNR